MASAFIITGICLAAVTSARPMGDAVIAHASTPEKVSGYAEYKKGDTLIVDGQRVVSGPKTRAVKDIPFGYEVTVTGRRDASGTVIADKVDAKPNGQDDTEKEIIASTDKAEQTWVEKKMMFEPTDSLRGRLRRQQGTATVGKVQDEVRRGRPGHELLYGRSLASNGTDQEHQPPTHAELFDARVGRHQAVNVTVEVGTIGRAG